MLLVLIINSARRGSRAGDKPRQTQQTQTEDEIVTVVGAQNAKGASSEHKWDKHRKLYMMHKKWLKATGREARSENLLCILPLTH